MESLADARIDNRYIEIIKYIYENATTNIQLNNMVHINIERGIRQGNNSVAKTVHLSSQGYIQKAGLARQRYINKWKETQPSALRRKHCPGVQNSSKIHIKIAVFTSMGC